MLFTLHITKNNFHNEVFQLFVCRSSNKIKQIGCCDLTCHYSITRNSHNKGRELLPYLRGDYMVWQGVGGNLYSIGVKLVFIMGLLLQSAHISHLCNSQMSMRMYVFLLWNL